MGGGTLRLTVQPDLFGVTSHKGVSEVTYVPRASVSVTTNFPFSFGEGSTTPTPRQLRPSASLNLHTISERSPPRTVGCVTLTAEPACGVFDAICLLASAMISAAEAGVQTS